MSAKRSFDCPHGLDMRLHPRCYLCTPLPETRVFTPPAPVPVCTCPTVWYGTMRPLCPVHNPVITNTVGAKP